MSQIVRIIKATVASLALACSTMIGFTLMMPFALLKLVLPFKSARRVSDAAINAIAENWVGVNQWWMDMVGHTRWHLSGHEGHRRQGWYLVSSNHQSWVDILVLQRVFNRRIPMLKFFTKKELIYVPVIGFAWWALDFPFMQRKGGVSARADLEAGRKACEKFRLVPTSVMSFVEGTRFTPAKHAQQKSPYRHLLKPKVGSIGMALEALGDAFTGFLDVTIVYPDGTPTFTDALAGRLGNVVVRVHLRSIPAEVLPPPGEPAPRAAVQAWVNELWQAKDEEIEQVLAERKNKAN